MLFLIEFYFFWSLVFVQGRNGGIGALDDDVDHILAVRRRLLMRTEEKGLEEIWKSKKGRVLGLVILGNLGH
jgi:hypothetical protein